METVIRRAELSTRPAGLLAVGVAEASAGAGKPRSADFAARLDTAGGGALRALLESGDFTGRAGETALLYPKGIKARRVLAVGLGRAADLAERGVLL
ncbi:MAG TPA: M17 family peptidase N-terminal domain-containing protein, partial [Candidatus Eisenbacteria bacterium]